MKKKAKLFIIYFPVLLVAGQMATNCLYFISNTLYNQLGFYLNLTFGTNILFAIFLVVFTMRFKFCAVSRYAAIAQLLFAVNYLIVKQDNLYNILFQLTVGLLAIVLTFRHYINKFPLCRLSLFFSFMSSIISAKGHCQKGLERWEQTVSSTIEKKFNEGRL